MFKFFKHWLLVFYSKIFNLMHFLVFILVLLYSKKQDITNDKVLFIRLDAIGDFVLWLDAVKDIKQLYPSHKYNITLLGNNSWTSFAKGLKYFDDILELDRKKFNRNLIYRFRLMKRIRRLGFHTVIQPTFSREFYYGDVIVGVTGAKERIGSEGDLSNSKQWQRNLGNLFYTKLIPAKKELVMELIRNAEFMRGLGLDSFKCNVPVLHLSEDITEEQLILGDYYVLFPGASWKGRQWPIDSFSKLAKLIYEKTGWKGVLCGGPSEVTICEKLVKKASNIPLINLTGRTSIKELSSIISKANLIVTNDTSAVHIAAAVSTPAVCILGGGHFGRFLPYQLEQPGEQLLPTTVSYKMDCYNCNWNCIYKVKKGTAVPCISNVSVDDVWKQVLIILNKGGIGSEYSG